MMTRRVVALVAFVLIIPVVVAIASPAWAQSVGLDVWNVTALREQAVAAAELERELEAEDVEICRRIEVKEQLVQSLIAGRSTLADTAAQFTALDQSYPEYRTVVGRSQHGATEAEKMARNVIEYALPRLSDEPALHRTFVQVRLNVELRALCEYSHPPRAN